MSNKLIIAGAGSGKTTFLVSEALKIKEEKVLITTYTEANEEEIRRKFLKINNGIPNNVTIQTWFSFLLQHWVKPFQGSYNEALFEYDIKGMLLVSKPSGVWFYSKKFKRNIYYTEDKNFFEHYFTKKGKIYSDKISKFGISADGKSNGNVMKRLEKIYPNVFIDEVQDLAGYDLELIKSMMKSNSNVLLVGDPRQVTYLTHHEVKHSGYKNGNVKRFLEDKCKRLIGNNIDETTLSKSHRNNQIICDYSALLYPELPKLDICGCHDCHNENIEHQGIFLIKPDDIAEYLNTYKTIQLRWNISTKGIKEDFDVYNFGESKGLTFDRVLIFPTPKMAEWIKDNKISLETLVKSKLYVGITRAKYSVAFVLDYDDNSNYNGCININFLKNNRIQ
ncbi:UvrD-helicase domain-containing protein [Flavobacterium gawalongense]|uniref:AAA family ATPase n=1 Tax=Flavobacterium gawalongense TaxID=2594432 RepID=A0ABY3CPX0_9FLAO|nr:UvrD-helicase domain-containing protein [Flavobacterium gawalongense]TRX03217.1 AAA family ATPase [Flavobacterium gawalongense]TRX09879.1 AAA family ATPase [Flavobacterium gawalongense]